MRWPWQRIERRSESSYTEQLVQLLAGNADGKAVKAGAIGALEACAGLVSRAFASCDVAGPGVVVDALTPSTMALVGRALIRRGEVLLTADVREGELLLVPVQAHDVRGTHDPATWRYRVTVAGPTTTRTRSRVAAERVLHFRYAADPERPWRGYGPLAAASITGRLSANVAAALADESAGPRGMLLPVPRAQPDPDNPDTDTTAKLREDIRGLKGSLAVVEDASDMFQTGAATPGAANNWTPRRIGMDPPEGAVAVAELAFREVVSACGLSPALFDARAAAATREAWRQALFGVIAPLGSLVQEELRAKVHPDVTLSWDELRASDLSGRARAFQSMVQGGMDPAKAAALAGLMEPDEA